MWDENGQHHPNEYYDNSPGKICKMPRKECDEDSHQCCSRGLHFCSLPYLGPVGNWAGGTDILIVVKINPRDVVAVPYSYQDTKGRCCRFEVLRIWQGADDIKDLSRDAWDKSLVAETEEVTDPAVRALLNLARIEEAKAGFELHPNAVRVAAPVEEGVDEASDEPKLDVGPVTTDLCFNGSKLPKGEECRKLLLALLEEAEKTNLTYYAFTHDRDHKVTGDLRVSPKGHVCIFNKDSLRWEAWFTLTK